MSYQEWNKRNKAFVLSLFDTGVGVVRSLGRSGVPVVGLDSNTIMPGFNSRYCEAKLSPDPVHEPGALLDFLVDEGKKLDLPGVLMPASDAYVMFMAQYQEVLREWYLFTLPPERVIEGLVNKQCQYELAEEAGIPLAKSYYPTSMAEVQRLKDNLDYPVFIKPYLGHLWREVYGPAHKGFEVGTPEELVTRYEDIFANRLDAMVQSIIVGPDSNLFEICVYIGRSGEPLGAFTHQKIHQYPPRYGVCTTAESLEYPELVELGLKLLRAFDYRGVSSIEFKRDDRDGQLKLIELNPRFGQQNMLAADCGVNLPLIQYLDLTGHRQDPVCDFRTGVKWMDPVIDFPSFWQYYRAGETTIGQWLASWRGVRSFPVFALDDLGPFFKKYRYGKKLLEFPVYLWRNRR